MIEPTGPQPWLPHPFKFQANYYILLLHLAKRKTQIGVEILGQRTLHAKLASHQQEENKRHHDYKAYAYRRWFAVIFILCKVMILGHVNQEIITKSHNSKYSDTCMIICQNYYMTNRCRICKNHTICKSL